MPHQSPAVLAKLAAAALCITLVAACREGARQQDETENEAIGHPAPQGLPIVEPPFDRARLLLAVARAASAHSAGSAESPAQRTLDGRQFEVRLRFGCDGPGPGIGGHGWSLDPDGRTLRLRAVPNLSLDDEMVRSVATGQVEAVEGFWLPRPWLLQASCPNGSTSSDPEAAGAEPATSNGETKTGAATGPAPQRIGIAQFFTADDARTRRRMSRPFEAVRQLAAGEQAGRSGFDLVLSGRLRARADGRVILCSGSGRDGPPDCLVSASIDRVWIESPDDKTVMADWSS